MLQTEDSEKALFSLYVRLDKNEWMVQMKEYSWFTFFEKLGGFSNFLKKFLVLLSLVFNWNNIIYYTVK